MEKKQTAVEWLEQQLNPDLKTMQGHIMQDLLEQAKQMEKRQMLNFVTDFCCFAYGADEFPVYTEDLQYYYKKYMEK